MALTLVALLGMAASASSAEPVVLEDFEQYANGDVVAAAATSVPWGRFGYAVNDNLTATSQSARVIAGQISGAFPVGWGQSDTPPRNSATLRNTFDAPKDLSGHESISVKVRTMAKTTETSVKVMISDATTTYASKKSVPVTNEMQEITFELKGADFERTDGQANFPDVLSKAASLSLRFENKTEEASETLVIDDLVLQ
jgi:hypothetical protein